jgi:Domain of unknown function (DU1801)
MMRVGIASGVLKDFKVHGLRLQRVTQSPIIRPRYSGRNSMDDNVRRLLDDFSPEVQHLATSVRARIFELVPDAQEKVMRGYNSLSYGLASGMQEQFASIVLHRERVNLQLHRATELLDPAGLLEGTGKAMRHVKVQTEETAQSKEVGELIESAAALSRP